MILLIIMVIVIVCFIFMLMNNKQKQIVDMEHFQWDPLWVGRQSLDCYGENPKDCLAYSNCGLCYKNGQKRCLPGDTEGPFFEENCGAWKHTNYYDRYIFGEKVTTLRPSFDKWYPSYEVYYPSPIARSTLQSFREQSGNHYY